jgi:hypothetical protein
VSLFGQEVPELTDNLLKWINDHKGVGDLAAWVQAVGIITSFSVAIYFSRQDARRRRAKERRQARALVPLLLPALVTFRRKINDAEANPREATNFELPNKVTRRAKDFQLVEGAANYLSLLQDQLLDLNNAIHEMQNAAPSERTKREDDVQKGLRECRQTLDSMIDEMKAISS